MAVWWSSAAIARSKQKYARLKSQGAEHCIPPRSRSYYSVADLLLWPPCGGVPTNVCHVYPLGGWSSLLEPLRNGTQPLLSQIQCFPTPAKLIPSSSLWTTSAATWSHRHQRVASFLAPTKTKRSTSSSSKPQTPAGKWPKPRKHDDIDCYWGQDDLTNLCGACFGWKLTWRREVSRVFFWCPFCWER